MALLQRDPYKPLSTRIFARNDAEAQSHGGPGAVAVKRTSLILPIGLYERAQGATAALDIPNVDTSRLVEMALEGLVEQLEAEYNGGEHFGKPNTVQPAKDVFRIPAK